MKRAAPSGDFPRWSRIGLGALLASLFAAVALPSVGTATAASADLSVDQTDAPDPATTSDQLTYSIQVENHGPDAATAVRVIDRIPKAAEFIDADSSRGPCNRSMRRVVCGLGVMQAGETATASVRVRPTREGTVTNVVSLERAVPDPQHANDNEKERTVVQTPAPPVTCGGREATLVGTGGDDVLVGTPGADVIAASGGSDSVRGTGGDDVICGSTGNDVVRGGGGDDVVKGGGASDDVFGGTGGDLLFGKGGRDRIEGGGGNDSLRGGAGADRCHGNGGQNTRRSC